MLKHLGLFAAAFSGAMVANLIFAEAAKKEIRKGLRSGEKKIRAEIGDTVKETRSDLKSAAGEVGDLVRGVFS